MINKVEILGVKVDFIKLENALSLIEKWVNSNKKHQITTPNPEQIILAYNDYRFKEILNHSSLAVADGIGLVWAARLLKNQPARQFPRLSGVDLMVELCQLAAKKNWSVFLLGGRDQAAEQAAEQLKKSYPQLKVGYDCGSSNVQKETEQEKKAVVAKINNFQPRLLFVAYGAPQQEKWLKQNLPFLKVKVAMGVGGAFDYLGGKVDRAPRSWQKIGLEWLWRLGHQPWRLGRQLRLIKFVLLVIKEKLF